MEEPVRMMLLDATFTDAPSSALSTPPSVVLYGLDSEGGSIAVHVNDFVPYFWFPAPLFKVDGKEVPLDEGSLSTIKERLNEKVVASRKKAGDQLVAAITVAYRTPLMYYRRGGPFLFLKVEVWRGKDIGVVAKELSELAEENEMRSEGLIWKDRTSHEEGIKLGMRFFCDTAMTGGAWVEVKQASSVPHDQQKTRCSRELAAGWRNLVGLSPDATQHMEFTHTTTDCSREIILNTSVPAEEPRLPRSTWSLLAPLRIVSLHVQCAGGGKVLSESSSSSGRGRGRGKGRGKSESLPKGRASEEACVADIESLAGGGSSLPSRDPVLLISHILHSQGKRTSQVVFTHGKSFQQGALPGVEVREFLTEAAMLTAWREFFHSEVDPDVVCVYQMKESLRYVAERFKVLKLGAFDLGRHKGQTTEVKSVVTYGKHWVRQQARMSSTSNQEVFRAFVEGRLVIDVLRVVLVSFNLSTFTLGECSQAFRRRFSPPLQSQSFGTASMAVGTDLCLTHSVKLRLRFNLWRGCKQCQRRWSWRESLV